MPTPPVRAVETGCIQVINPRQGRSLHYRTRQDQCLVVQQTTCSRLVSILVSKLTNFYHVQYLDARFNIESEDTIVQALKRSFCGANNLDATIRTREDIRVRVEATFELHNAYLVLVRNSYQKFHFRSEIEPGKDRERLFFCEHHGIRTIDHAHAKQGSNHQAVGE